MDEVNEGVEGPERVGKLIRREHDAHMLNKSLDALREAQAQRRPSKAGGGGTQACALTRPLVRKVAVAASVASPACVAFASLRQQHPQNSTRSQLPGND